MSEYNESVASEHINQKAPAPKIDFEKIVVDVLANTYQTALIDVSKDEILEQERLKKEMALELKAIQD